MQQRVCALVNLDTPVPVIVERVTVCEKGGDDGDATKKDSEQVKEMSRHGGEGSGHLLELAEAAGGRRERLSVWLRKFVEYTVGSNLSLCDCRGRDIRRRSVAGELARISSPRADTSAGGHGSTAARLPLASMGRAQRTVGLRAWDARPNVFPYGMCIMWRGGTASATFSAPHTSWPTQPTDTIGYRGIEESWSVAPNGLAIGPVM